MTRADAPPLSERRFLVHGLGITNRAVVAALRAHGRDVVLSGDGDEAELRELAASAGAEAAVHRPDRDELVGLLERVDAVVPAPGLPDRHPLFEAVAAVQRPVLSEFDLAATWDDRRVVAVTGTNGKTTVATLLRDMLLAAGIPTVAVGNLETPLVAAIADPTPEVFVVEASSFRLARSRWFRPEVAVWLNFAEDHLDVHRDLATYRAAKERITADQQPSDLAVLNADDPTVTSFAAQLDDDPTGPEVWRFSVSGPAELDLSGRHLRVHGTSFATTDRLWSQLPHDRANVLAAAGAAVRMGAALDAVGAAASAFDGLAHRVQFVAERDGVRFYDDSKATAPHATLSALAGFDSVVLIAGGRNKGLDLGVLAAAGERVRAVVGIGESADEVLDAFAEREGVRAPTMDAAVRAAAGFARSGDAVVLSPACASFDWYGSYAERGDDFARAVRTLATEVPR